MVILLFTNLFPNSEDPNYGIFVYRRAKQLQLFGHSVRAVAPVPYFPKWLPIPKSLRSRPRISRWLRMSRIPAREQWGGITVYHPRYFLAPGLSAPLHGFLMFSGALLRVCQLHLMLQFDCLDAHFVYPDGFASVLLGKVLRLPVIVTAHGTDLNLYTQYSLLRPLIRWTLNEAARTICVSMALRNIALSLGISKEKVVVIPNGVDLDYFRPVGKKEARRALGIPVDSKVVLTVGQLISRKGHRFLIDAVAHLRGKFPNLRLFIVGEGGLREPLLRRVSALGLGRHVCLTGAINNEELFRWYSAADVLCLPSSREGFPCVLVESLACGTPVVGTKIAGITEIINSREVGLLVQQNGISISEGLEEAFQVEWSPLVLSRQVRQLTWTQTGMAINEVLARSLHPRRAIPSLVLKANR